MENDLYNIAKEITDYMGVHLTKRVYIAIAGKNGELYYTDTELEDYIEFIQNFMKSSFSLLKVNDHAMPYSSLNLVFFKPSNNIAIILYAREDTVKPAQLLTFKGKMANYGASLEELLKGNFPPIIEAPEVEEAKTSLPKSSIPEQPVEIESKNKIREIPYLLKKLKDKNKFEMTESVVLNLINNRISIDEICEKSKFTRDQVDEIIKKYKEKGWIRVRIVEPEVITKKQINIFPKLTEPVSLTYGFPKDEQLVLANCTGKDSIDSIFKKTSIKKSRIVEILDKYEEKDWLSFTSDGTPDYIPKNLKKLSPMGVQLGLMSQKEYNIRELCMGDVSASSIAKSLDIDYEELIKVLKEMEKNKDIRLRIKKM